MPFIMQQQHLFILENMHKMLSSAKSTGRTEADSVTGDLNFLHKPAASNFRHCNPTNHPTPPVQAAQTFLIGPFFSCPCAKSCLLYHKAPQQSPLAFIYTQ